MNCHDGFCGASDCDTCFPMLANRRRGDREETEPEEMSEQVTQPKHFNCPFCGLGIRIEKPDFSIYRCGTYTVRSGEQFVSQERTLHCYSTENYNLKQQLKKITP